MYDRLRFKAVHPSTEKLEEVMEINFHKKEIVFYDGDIAPLGKLYQCTDVKDRDGKLFFEEDLAEGNFGRIYLIDWLHGGFRVCRCQNGSDYTLNRDRYNLKIIGHSWNNPEILEKYYQQVSDRMR